MLPDQHPAAIRMSTGRHDRSISRIRLGQTFWRCALQVTVRLAPLCGLAILGLAIASDMTPGQTAAATALAAAAGSGSVFRFIAYRQISKATHA